MSTSPYGLSPALIFFISQLQGSCKPKEIWDIRCTCSIHAAKARWKAEAFLCILQGAAAGRRGAPASADSASVMQQANCTVADLHPTAGGAWFTLGEADVFPLLPSTHIPALHSGIHRWFKGTQMAIPLWPHCDAICLSSRRLSPAPVIPFGASSSSHITTPCTIQVWYTVSMTLLPLQQ